MAKTRVTDLAKEFGIDIKELLLRLKEMNIEAKNYLSSLDETNVELVRNALAKVGPQVEEQRLGSNIKRRRRMAPKTRPPREKVMGPSPIISESPAEVSEVQESQETDFPQVPPEESSAVGPTTPPTSTRRRKKPSTKAARIIALPEVAEPSVPLPIVEPVVELEKVAKQPVSPVPPPEALPHQEGEITPPPLEKPQIEPIAPEGAEVSGIFPESGPPAPKEDEPVSPVSKKATTVPDTQTPDTSAALRRQKAKKAKKDSPARIISLPTPQPPAEPAPAKRPSRPRIIEVAKAKIEPAAIAGEKPEEKKPRTNKKKRGKRPGEAAVEEPAKKKVARKKEVREGAELYEGREAEASGLPKKKGAKKAVRKVAKTELTVPKAIKRRIKVGDSITVGELAKRMGIKFSEIVKKLMGLGIMATINQPIDYDSSVLVANDFGYEVERASLHEEDILELQPQVGGELVHRPPVVTIMGHVDHGKTSLLDGIRQSRLIDAEAGGITQHIGAYHVSLDRGEVVFLDTPGHEAFTSMRARGAQVTDVVVLVVAADDGIMPQTLEAINHAKAAGVPLVVAINKIDKPNANPERVIRELADRGVVPEEWGGDVQFAEISAKKRIGIEELLEKILLQAEILELRASTTSLARGRIIEAKLDKGRGPLGTVLVQNGTLKNGDAFVCGLQYGRVRAMFDDRGQKVEEATPAIPVEVQGFSGVPNAGDEFMVLEDDRVAKQVALMRQQKQREAAMARISKVTLEKLYERFQEGAIKELNLIIKADVQGSIEALTQAVSELGTKEIKVHLIHTGTGDITETDIMLASASSAIVIGFNVRINPKAQSLAEQEQVDVKFYDVIYHLVSDIHSALEGMLEPIQEERPLGRAEVRQVFSIPKLGMIAGSHVLDGKVERNSLVRVRRDNTIVFEGKISSLKRFKEDVKEVTSGYECGIGLEKFSDLREGDILEAYHMEAVKALLEPLPGRQE